jgi:hypothetical protein
VRSIEADLKVRAHLKNERFCSPPPSRLHGSCPGKGRIALSLLECVAAKATENRDTGSTSALEKLIIELSAASTAPGAAKSAAELAAEAKRKAAVRTALVAGKSAP